MCVCRSIYDSKTVEQKNLIFGSGAMDLSRKNFGNLSLNKRGKEEKKKQHPPLLFLNLCNFASKSLTCSSFGIK